MNCLPTRDDAELVKHKQKKQPRASEAVLCVYKYLSNNIERDRDHGHYHKKDPGEETVISYIAIE